MAPPHQPPSTSTLTGAARALIKTNNHALQIPVTVGVKIQPRPRGARITFN